MELNDQLVLLLLNFQLKGSSETDTLGKKRFIQYSLIKIKCL